MFFHDVGKLGQEFRLGNRGLDKFLNQMEIRGMKLILASSSPRRKNLLAEAGFVFDVLSADIDESVLPNESPEVYVTRLAIEKAKTIAAKIQSPANILAADTTVALQKEILGKPIDEEDAYAMLQKLSGKTHRVLTGYALISPQSPEITSGYELTEVDFRILSQEEILAYIATKEPMDKAGAYALQGGAKGFVAAIRGSQSNVVGLPMEVMTELLKQNKI